jgi:hypothetical protein
MNIRDLIIQLIKDNEEKYSLICKVIEVDRDKRLCVVEPKNGDAAIYDVRLQSIVSSQMGLVLFPEIESDVTVAFLSKELAFITQTSIIQDIKLNIGDFSLEIDAENFTKSVKNVLINSTRNEQNSENTIINSDNYDLTSENAKFTTSQMFEVLSNGIISLDAQLIALDATNIDITGITTINGLVTVNGAAAISGAVSMGGGVNGGIPKGAALAQELNKIVAEINKIKDAFDSWTPISNDGGAALKTIVNGLLSSLNDIDVSNISNTNALH